MTRYLTLHRADQGEGCEKCGCTNNRACPGGCSWDERSLRKGKLICSSCAPKRRDR